MTNTIAAHSHRRLAGVIALGVVLTLGAPLGAQQPPPATPRQTPAPPPAPTGPVLQLSMDQAVVMGLETNLGLKSTRLNVDIAAQGIVSAHASFLPQLQSSVSRNTSQSASSSFTDVTSTTISNSNVNVSASLSQALRWYGGRYSLSWSNGRRTTSAVGATFNPGTSSTFSFNFSQPLLQGFLIDGTRVGLETSERQRVITDLDLQQQVLTLQASVRDAYLNLIASIENRKVVQQNMDATQQQLHRAQAQVAVGTAAAIDVIQAQAQVASNEVSVIGAGAQVDLAQDSLRALILDPARPDYWQVQFDATDAIELNPRDVDVEAAIKNALANRLDLLSARQNMQITDLNLKLDENLTKPSVNATASYSSSGTGGTQNSYTPTFPPVLTSSTTKGFGSVLGEAFGGAFPQWTVGVTVAYPIGRTGAEASLASARIRKQQQEINLRSLELQVVNQVRQFGRAVQTSLKQVQASQAALKANEQQYDAELRRFAVGLTDTFQVLTKQQQLAQARLSELQARIAYNQSILNFEKVQKIH